MPAVTQTVRGPRRIIVTVPPSTDPQEIEVSAWKNRRRDISVCIAHDGRASISKPVSDDPIRRGESEMEAMSEHNPDLIDLTE